ncbi:MAG: hypothetical protein P8098_15805 [Candidatus Thiodiazotropha sp.]
MQALSEEDRAELLVLYQVTVDDIEKTKQWGWTVTYTTIAAQGATLGLYIAYSTYLPIIFEKLIFIALILGFALVARNQINQAQDGIHGFRERVLRVRKSFGSKFDECFGETANKRVWPLGCVMWSSTVVFSLLVVLACKA